MARPDLATLGLVSPRLKLELREAGLDLLLRALSDLPSLGLAAAAVLRLTLEVLGLVLRRPSRGLLLTPGLSSRLLPVLRTEAAVGPASATPDLVMEPDLATGLAEVLLSGFDFGVRLELDSDLVRTD